MKVEASDKQAARTWVVRSGADLGRTIAGVRSASNLTQAELARRAGLDRTYLARIEAGASVQLIERALRALRRMGATVTVTLPEADDS